MAYKVEVVGGQTKYLPNVKAPAESHEPKFVKIPTADFLLLEANEEQLVRVAEALESIAGAPIFGSPEPSSGDGTVRVEASTSTIAIQGLEVDDAVERLVGEWVNVSLLLRARDREVGLIRIELHAALERVEQVRREHKMALDQIELMRGKDLRRPASEIPTIQVPDVGAIDNSTEMLLGAMQAFIRQIQAKPLEVARPAGGGKIDP